MATRALLAELCEAYAAHAATTVHVESVGGVDAAKRLRAGESFDFTVLAADAIAQLAAEGHVVAGSERALAHSGIAVAVPKGARQPDISTEEAVRLAVLAAPSIGYSTGPSGTALMKLFERWGIAGELKERLVQAPPGVPVGSLVARGDVALGFQQLSELMHRDDIAVVGDLPAAIQINTTFTAAVCRASQQQEAAARFCRFLASADAAPHITRQGMTPA